MAHGSQEVNISWMGSDGACNVNEPTRCCAIMNATISPCSVQLFSRTTLFIPTATRRPVVSKIAAPNGPPLPCSTFARATVIATRMRSASVAYALSQSTSVSTHSGYST